METEPGATEESEPEAEAEAPEMADGLDGLELEGEGGHGPPRKPLKADAPASEVDPAATPPLKRQRRLGYA